MAKQCPRCGNWVNGVKKRSFTQKVGQKAGTNIAAKLAGGAVGWVFGPVGAVAGAAIAGAIADEFSDDIVDEFSDGPTFRFECPKCGYHWNSSCNIKYNSGIHTAKKVNSNTVGTIIYSLLQERKTDVEYLEVVKECLEEDNEISPRERRLLEKLRTKLGISEERAKELEATLSAPQLTEEEQEYLEEYRVCLEEDGEISPKERRLLDKLRVSLGISEGRAKEIETFKR